ncbi:MAG: choice-of-anchor D domain-containing protein, partial [Planctomycetota bacterium]
LGNDANEYVMADGVRIERVGNPAPEVTVLDGSTNIADGTGSMNFGTTAPGSPVQRTFTVKNDGGAALTLQPVSVTTGFSVVSNISANTVVAPGGQVTFVVRLDAATLGAFSGTLSFVNTDSDENPFDFTLSGTVAAAPLIVIMDNGDAGFSAPGYTTITGEGFQNDIAFAAAGSGSSIATWNFNGLLPGVYRVSAAWSTHSNRATNSPFTVYDGVTNRGTVRLNQELAPNDRVDAGTNWEDLGSSFMITGTTLVVKLGNDANEYVMADGVRIERLSPLLAAGGEIAGSSAGALTNVQLQPIVAAAITRLGHEGFDPQVLSRVVFTIEDLPGATLGVAGSQAISIDANAAGHGWFIDATPLGDREFTDGTLPLTTMDLLSVVIHELGHTAGLVDLYDPDHADELMAGFLQAGTRHDAGSEHAGSGHAGSEHTITPSVASVPVATKPSDLFAVGDAVVDVSRYAIVQKPVSRLSSLIVKVEDPDMRKGFGPMPESDNSEADLSSAAIDELFLGLLDPGNAFDLFS